MNTAKKPSSQQVAPSKKSSSIFSKNLNSVSLKREDKRLLPENLLHKDIELRAYFISERRRKLGWEGDEQTDWLEAKKQLLAEMLEKESKE